ncbi:hypothetical protein [Halolamina sp.]|jgi:hypothetical protein|uniref:hypothetical protein n=1 Tax=Halolamina sp. TaxID=1940283 RepID=UPI000223BA62|nr:hypothetical protein Halar_3593 [halophilic archaeon DL31]
MSTGDPPGFLTVLPFLALVGLLGSSFLLAYAARRFAGWAGSEDPPDRPSPKSLVAVCATLHLLVLLAAAVVLGVVGGLPSGPLWALDEPFLTLVAVYGVPLAIAARGFSLFLSRGVRADSTRRSGFLSTALFAVGHLGMVVTVWGCSCWWDRAYPNTCSRLACSLRNAGIATAASKISVPPAKPNAAQ